MKTIHITETGHGATVELTGEQARRLARSGLVAVAPGPGPGLWSVRGKGVVGAARIADIELWVKPKVPVARLLFLLGYARSPEFWRDEPIELSTADDLVPTLAAALARQVRRALAPGVLHGYISVDEASPVLRGRLREGEQMARQLARALPLEIRRDEFTVDIPENQVLATAIHRMLRLPRVAEADRRALRHLLAQLADVTVLPAGAATPRWAPTRLNARYHIALRLAEFVIAGTSLETSTGSITSDGFVIDMPSLFEDFLMTALREAVERKHGGAVVGKRPQPFDRAARHSMKPDISWLRQGRVRAVIDAKYKTDAPIEDLYQMLAYCTVLGLPRGHLVYASGTPLTTYGVRNSDVEITCHSLDLDQPPAVLLAQIDRLADFVASVAP